MTDKSLLFYLNQISKTPLLTREEEYKLAKLANKGDEKAKNRLVQTNLRFVVQMAKRYTSSRLSLADLISEGNLGLIRAVDSFDPDKGFHFISYAVYWIKQSIIKSISEKSKIIRLPLNINNTLSNIKRFMRDKNIFDLSEENVKVIAREMHLPEKEINRILEASQQHTSLNRSLKNNGDKMIQDIVEDTKSPPPHHVAIESNLKENINEILAKLTPLESYIIQNRFGLNGSLPKTLLEIGKEKGLTKERIRQIEKLALNKIKSLQGIDELKEFVA